MTEVEAVAWVSAADVPCGTIERLQHLVRLIQDEATRQNLVAPSTLRTIWARHIVDSLQLLVLAPSTGEWFDIGAGAGFPGLTIAAARHRDMILIEPRKLRASFLTEAAHALAMTAWVKVAAAKVETMTTPVPAAVISARAVAPLDRLFAAAAHLSGPDTVWLLMKGAKARDELEAARASWQGDFRLAPSVTDPAASIVVARNVRRRG